MSVYLVRQIRIATDYLPWKVAVITNAMALSGAPSELVGAVRRIPTASPETYVVFPNVLIGRAVLESPVVATRSAPKDKHVVARAKIAQIASGNRASSTRIVKKERKNVAVAFVKRATVVKPITFRQSSYQRLFSV